jgi:hypothetical protein
MVQKTYELIGVKVLNKEHDFIYSGKHAGKEKFVLKISVEDNPKIDKITAYKGKLGLVGNVSQEQMWQDIKESNYADKRYLFYYHFGNYGSVELVGWKELGAK